MPVGRGRARACFLVSVLLPGAIGLRTLKVGILSALEDPDNLGGPGAMAALLAADQFNARDGSIVAAFSELGDCDVQIEAIVADTERNSKKAAISKYVFGKEAHGWHAIVGEVYSSVSVPLALLSGIYNTSQVSFGSTSSALSDLGAYPTFSRTCAASSSDGHSITAYIAHHGWTRIAVIYVNDAYGAALAATVSFSAAKRGITVESAYYTAGDEPSILAAVRTLAADAQNRIVVHLSPGSDDLQYLLAQSALLGMIGNTLHHWIFTTNPTKPAYTNGVRDLLDGSVYITQLGGVEGHAPYDGLLSLYAASSWDGAYMGRFPASTNYSSLTGEAGFTDYDPWMAFAFDAMALLGLAACSRLSADNTTLFSGSELHDSITAVSFIGASGTLEFDRYGTRLDSTAQYGLAIMNLVNNAPNSLTLRWGMGSYVNDTWTILDGFRFFGGSATPPSDGTTLPLPVPALAPSIGIDSGSSGADNSDKAEPVATSPAGLDDLVSGAQRLIVALSTVGCFMVLVLVILLVRFLRALLRKRKLAAIQLLDQSRAEAASEARSRLIRTVMHDLRSPLMAVSNTVHALLAMPAPRPSLDATKPQLEAMKDCAHLMEGIISDMLDFERIEAGRLTLVAVPFYAADLVRVTRSTFDSNAAKRNVRFECTEPEGPLGGCELLGDARRLQQCVNNGVSNALKFTSEGGLVRVRMRVGELAAADRALLCVEVIDDGVGLSVEELALLNEDIPFTQVGLGQMQGNGGTGLGLSIVRQMLKLHTGSSLELQSAGHGEGVTYRLNVNCSRAQSNLTRQPSDRMLAMAARVALLTPSSLRGGLVLSRSSAAGFSELASETLEEVPFPAGYRVLHVDDDAFVRMTLPLTTFVTLGVEFRQAVHGGEALRLLQAGERFDFFVVDSQMPMMCGGPFTRELRALGFSGPVVGMTGDPAGGEDRREFESSGLTACFDKDMTGVAALIDEMRKHARYLYDHHGALDRQWPPLQHASTRPAILRVSSGVRSGGSGQHSGAQSYTQSSRQRVVPSNVSNGIVGFKQRAIDDSPTRTLDANSPAPPGRTGGRTRTHPVSSSSDETLCIASAGHLVTTL